MESWYAGRPLPFMCGRNDTTGGFARVSQWVRLDSLAREPRADSPLAGDEAVDFAGFIASRLMDVFLNEVMKLIQAGNKPEEIDKICTSVLVIPWDLAACWTLPGRTSP
jgi:3-hydroxyacyl-CoA dehydrogenase, C-terminal domain